MGEASRRKAQIVPGAIRRVDGGADLINRAHSALAAEFQAGNVPRQTANGDGLVIPYAVAIYRGSDIVAVAYTCPLADANERMARGRPCVSYVTICAKADSTGYATRALRALKSKMARLYPGMGIVGDLCKFNPNLIKLCAALKMIVTFVAVNDIMRYCVDEIYHVNFESKDCVADAAGFLSSAAIFTAHALPAAAIGYSEASGLSPSLCRRILEANFNVLFEESRAVISPERAA